MEVNDIMQIVNEFCDKLREDFTTHEVKDYSNATWPEILNDTRRSARWCALLELQNRISEVWLCDIDIKTEDRIKRS